MEERIEYDVIVQLGSEGDGDRFLEDGLDSIAKKLRDPTELVDADWEWEQGVVRIYFLTADPIAVAVTMHAWLARHADRWRVTEAGDSTGAVLYRRLH